MRQSREEKAKTHERIVRVASQRIREQGLDQPAVAEIMRAAGLTHGGFYKHFGSRDDLIAEATESALAASDRHVHELTDASRDATVRGLRAFVDGEPSAVATLLDGPQAGEKLYVDGSSRVGGLGGPRLLDVNVEREARGLVAHGRTTVRQFGEDGTTLGTGLRVHVTTHADPPQMIILGAIDFSAALATIAGGMGYKVTIADPRKAFLASARFSASAETVAAWPQEVIDRLVPGPRDAVLVFSHDAKLDVPALLAAFGTQAGSIGLVAARRNLGECFVGGSVLRVELLDRSVQFLERLAIAFDR